MTDNDNRSSAATEHPLHKALQAAYLELKKHAADYHHRTPVSVNSMIVDALAIDAPAQQPTEPVAMDDVVAVIRNEWGSLVCRLDDYAKRSCERGLSCACFDIANAIAAEFDIRKRSAQPPAAPVATVRLRQENDEFYLAPPPCSSAGTAEPSMEDLRRTNVELMAKLKESHQHNLALWEAIAGGPEPRCRDCADFDGRCQGNGLPCDPQERALEQIKRLRALPQTPSEREIALAIFTRRSGLHPKRAAEIFEEPPPRDVDVIEALLDAEAVLALSRPNHRAPSASSPAGSTPSQRPGE